MPKFEVQLLGITSGIGEAVAKQFGTIVYNEHQTNRSINLLTYTEPRTGPKSFLEM